MAHDSSIHMSVVELKKCLRQIEVEIAKSVPFFILLITHSQPKFERLDALLTTFLIH